MPLAGGSIAQLSSLPPSAALFRHCYSAPTSSCPMEENSTLELMCRKFRSIGFTQEKTRTQFLGVSARFPEALSQVRRRDYMATIAL